MTDIIEQAVGEIIVRDNTAQGVKSATANFQSLYGVVRDNWWGIQNLGNVFAGIGGTIAAGLGEAVKASVDFDQGLTQVGRTADISGKQLDDMGAALRELALTKPIDVNTLTKIAQDAAALGIQGVDNIKNFTGVIADLVSTTDLTEASAVQLARLGGVLGLQGEDWSRLGSAILYAGVHSAATEKDIVNMSVRLSGAAAAAHLTAAETVALAATVTSLGSSAQTGATSVNRAFQQIAKSAATGKPDLLEFAKVAGYDGPDAAKRFATAFNNDAGKAMAQFVTGLGSMRGNTIEVNKVLLDLGFTGQRGAQTLLQLAAGTQQNINPMLDLNKSLVMVQRAWDQDTELQKQAQKVYGSTANQLKMTENAVHDVAIGFGNVLLPVLNAVLKPILDVIWGFDQLPGPLKEALTVIGLVAAALALVGGSMIALAPRVILVLGSIREFQGVMSNLGNTAKMTMAALRDQAATEEEAAAITVRSATAMSRADRERAVQAYQTANAIDLKAIADRGAMEVEALASRASSLRADAAMQTAIAIRAQTEANDLLVESEMASLKGAADEAAVLEENAAAKQAVADSAAAAATEARALAAALAEDAAAAQAATAEELAAAEAAISLQVEEEAATGSAWAFGLALDSALGPIMLAVGVIAMLAAGLGIFGSGAHKAQSEAQDLTQVNLQLTDAIRKSGSTMSDQVRNLYLNDAAFLSAAAAVQKYKITTEDLLGVITGSAGANATDAMFANLEQRYKAGDKAAGAAHDQIRELMLVQLKAAQAAGIQADEEKKTGKSIDDTGDAASKASDSLQKLKAAHDAINNAILDLPEAMLNVRQAELSVTQAQQALSDAQNSGAQHAEDVKRAEDDLTQAYIDARKARADLAVAEQNLAGARAQAAQTVIDAQNKLADDNDKLLDTQDKIATLEAKIAAEREGPSVKDITDATNKLADANIKLLNSQKKVGDAQYMLNYLMAEGASTRDISDAQDQLAAARQDVADNTQAVADAQDNLNKVQAGTDPVQLAKDERDLAAAQRELQTEQRQLIEDTKALKQARDDQASDKAYKDALDAYQEAQIRLDAANMKVTDSTNALHKVQKESPADKVAQAQLNLESALFQLAKAHVQVTKDTALMHGEQFGAGKEAAALAGELEKMGLKASGPVAAHLKAMSDVLKNNVKDINDAGTAASNFGSGAAGPITGGLPVHIPQKLTGGAEAATGFKAEFKKHAKDIAAGILIVLGIAFALALGGIPAIVGGLAAAIIGALILIIKHWGPQIKNAMGVALGAIEEAATDVIGWIGDHWPLILAILTGPFGLLVLWLHNHWGEVTSVVSTAVDWIKKHWPLILAVLTGPFGLLVLWLHNNWGKVTGAVRVPWDWIKNNWHSILGWITNPFGSAVSWIESHLNSLTSWITGLPGRIGRGASRMFSWIEEAFKVPLRAMQGLWNELWEWLGNKSFTIGKISVAGHELFGGTTVGFGFLKGLEFHLPGLAEGGLVMNPTLVAAGEKGAEAIVPLDRMMEMFAPIDALALQMHSVNEALTQLIALQAAGSGGNLGGDTYHFHQVMADAEDIMSEVVWNKKVRLR